MNQAQTTATTEPASAEAQNPADSGVATVELETPIKRGTTEIGTLKLRKPNAGALRGVNMVMERGDLLAFTGKSGCGKSTLLNILGAVCTPTSGFYLFELKVQRFPNSPAGSVSAQRLPGGRICCLQMRLPARLMKKPGEKFCKFFSS